MQRHGLARRGNKHPGHTCWMNMKRRCADPTNHAYKYYGGRGITVCERWLVAFENFWEDMEPTWQKGLTLDRVDNEQGYSSENCRWTTRTEQSINQRRRLLPTGSLSAMSKETGISYFTLRKRLKQGVPTDQLAMSMWQRKGYEPVDLKALSRETGIQYGTLYSRYKRGVAIAELTTTQRKPT